MNTGLSVLFVCLGNVCRSPTADGLLRSKVAAAGLTDRITVDSAGTGSWHIGSSPDPRARAAADACGISLDGLRARQIVAADLRRFDYVIAMDRMNYIDLCSLAAENDLPSRKIELFTDLAPDAVDDPDDGVPDPYAGGADGFRHVFEVIDSGTDVLLNRLRKQLTSA